MQKDIQDEIAKSGIIAVLEIEDEKNAVPAAKALLEGGITVVELALRTPAAIPSISLIAKEVPQICIGIGTIIEAGQAALVKKENGVRFGVSPGLNPEIVKEAIASGLPFAPGIATPGELERAISFGCRTVKFFPAEGMGGLNYLKSINAPYNHLGVRYIPLGGINIDNLGSYAGFKPVLAVGGSWMAAKETIKSNNWKEITKRAKEAVEIWRNNKSV
ncbi:MAG: bifunctional 4-hydroxy-2-oxoglutarate aldolase/2-dehydro-3-deoxy-phosphogluconate aldolase [Treponema sp.]|nr:bifunctional 4-hydroxy-2-oxoglutarate aldolase/2-dehydro-3-deoxy-phosphogluconate aldolase [Treponema sp.]MCL2272848.1 bifunctional 4-hydroxy-2-oxoglutarate aldolase/2-dehydro-3-deoxy-phosphogluconate aldolase [Treponema sp.]